MQIAHQEVGNVGGTCNSRYGGADAQHNQSGKGTFEGR